MKKNCKICKVISDEGVNILGIHICSDCLNSIKSLDMESSNYEMYKEIIGDSLKECERLKLS